MTRIRIASLSAATLAAGAALIVAVSSTSASTNRATVASSTTIGVEHTELGNVLVDHGRTVYVFQADRHDVSTASSAVLKFWPAVLSAAKPHAGSGAKAADLSTIRTHGGHQVTYDGHPLYFFVADVKSGQITGQGIHEGGSVFYAISPSGHVIKSAAPKTSSPTNTTTSSSSTTSSAAGSQPGYGSTTSATSTMGVGSTSSSASPITITSTTTTTTSPTSTTTTTTTTTTTSTPTYTYTY